MSTNPSSVNLYLEVEPRADPCSLLSLDGVDAQDRPPTVEQEPLAGTSPPELVYPPESRSVNGPGRVGETSSGIRRAERRGPRSYRHVDSSSQSTQAANADRRVIDTHAVDLADYRERRLPEMLKEIGITPLNQRKADGDERKYADLTIYQLYLALQEPQKKLQFHKKTTQFLLSISERIAIATVEEEDAKFYKPVGSDFGWHKCRFEKKNGKDALYLTHLWMSKLVVVLERWATKDLLTCLIEHETMERNMASILRSIPDFMLRDWLERKKKNPVESLLVGIETEVGERTGNGLNYLLSAEDEVKVLLSLRNQKAQKIIDFLDEISDRLKPTDYLNMNCQRVLRRLCGRAALLPSSFTLKEGLEKVSSHPVNGGGFADVYIGRYQGQKVALKALRVYGKDNKKIQKVFCREAVFWKRLVHPNIVRFLGIADSELFPLCMVSTWMEHGSLLVYLKKRPSANRLELILDITKGLLYLHQLGIVHGDLKSVNVLIDEKERACLSDFGLSSVTHDARTASTMATSTALHGSIRWMAPELLHPSQAGRDSSRATAESDVYALAMVMLEAFTGAIPFYDRPNDGAVVIEVTLGMRPSRPGQEATARGLTDVVWHMIEECWQTDWRKRPRTPAILKVVEDAERDFVVPSPESLAPNATKDVKNLRSIGLFNGDGEESDSDYSSDDDDTRPFHRDLTKCHGDQDFVPPEFTISPDKKDNTIVKASDDVPLEKFEKLIETVWSENTRNSTTFTPMSSSCVPSIGDEDWY